MIITIALVQIARSTLFTVCQPGDWGPERFIVFKCFFCQSEHDWKRATKMNHIILIPVWLWSFSAVSVHLCHICLFLSNAHSEEQEGIF